LAFQPTPIKKHTHLLFNQKPCQIFLYSFFLLLKKDSKETDARTASLLPFWTCLIQIS
jgi:hypothetical protein